MFYFRPRPILAVRAALVGAAGPKAPTPSWQQKSPLAHGSNAAIAVGGLFSSCSFELAFFRQPQPSLGHLYQRFALFFLLKLVREPHTRADFG
jgi:hypothetical protein